MFKNRSFFRYLIIVGFFSFLSIFVVALINYKIDPTKVYSSYFKSSKNNDDISLSDFIEKLVSSKNGVIMKDYIWNERDIHYSLAEYPTGAECTIVGSSQVKQISSSRKNKSLVKTCNGIVNLGLNGGVLEDYLVMSQSIIGNKNPPKNIIFAISPWTLNFNRDSRWLHYKSKFADMLVKITNNKENKVEIYNNSKSYKIALFKNLINLKYFISSLNLLISKKDLSIEMAEDFNYDIGAKNKVLLPDGSEISSSEEIKKIHSHRIDGLSPLRNWGIVPGRWYDKNAIEIFIKLVSYLKKDFNIIFLMTPYHPEVWKIDDQPVVIAMKNVELEVHEIAKFLNVDVIGSFDPKKAGCDANEFINEIHAKDLCLSKLENVYTLN